MLIDIGIGKCQLGRKRLEDNIKRMGGGWKWLRIVSSGGLWYQWC
jgi:hypothetical protein